MIAITKYALALLALVAATQAAAQATFYEDEGFQGRSFTADQPVASFQRLNFNDSVSSIEIVGNRWEVCTDTRFGGRCFVLRPARYPSLAAINMDNAVSSARAISNDEVVDDRRYAPLPVAAAQIILYEHEGFQGRSFTTERQIANFDRFGFNDRASSIEVVGERWEVCEDVRFGGRCVILRPGRYGSLAAMGLNDRASSVRLATGNLPAPPPLPAPVPVAPQAIFYENENFQGRSFTTGQPIANFDRFGFNDRASSVELIGAPWEVCEDTRFTGRCIVLRPGRYASLAAMGLNNRASSVRIAGGSPPVPVPVASQATFYENENFQGRSFTTGLPIPNFERFGFNDRASSAEVVGERWEVCEDTSFRGRCIVLRPGRYASLAAMGLNNRASSVRAINNNTRIEDNRYAPVAELGRDYRRRDGERLYEATVTSVRAVVGTADQQRCWVERGQVGTTERGSANVPGAVIGGIIGGILGHQVGGGSGKDIATIGGVVGGAAIGANVGRDRAPVVSTQDVQRCENVAVQVRPDYWDVTYFFRGQEHRVQMSVAPGATVTVNEQGEPRG